MLRSLYNKLKYTLVTLRFSILSIFLTLFCVALLLVIMFGYLGSSKILLNMAEDLMTGFSTELYQKVTEEFNRIDDNSMLTKALIYNKRINPDDFEDMSNYLFALAKGFYIAEEVFWGDEKGNLVEVKFEPDNSLTTNIINRNKIPATRIYIYRDVNGHVVRRVNSNDLSLDPRVRPWYIAAKQAKQSVWTNIYLSRAHYLTITEATPIFNNDGSLRGVLGIAVPLNWLSWDLTRYKISAHSIAFIVDKNGTLIAFPSLYESESLSKLTDIHSISIPWVIKAFEIYQKSAKNKFNFIHQNKSYLANFKVIPQFASKGWIIGIAAPKDDFVGQLKITNLINTLLGLAILLIGVWLISKFVSHVVKPIKALANQTDEIKHFNLDEGQAVKTRIKEISILSNSIAAMRNGLKSFKKYVPAVLVRQLIEAGEDAVIGGSKKQIVIFFSDIENFTMLTEKMDPQLLMKHMCDYLNELSNILIVEGATIDKYIGDSIMAFWGAPTVIDHPCHRAARAALKCKNRLDILNEEWNNAGKPSFRTRIGIHTGEAVVGNIGSKERLNYTVLGETINIASRLEELNKTYHTLIIVSDAVYQIIKNDFLLRKLDHVAIRGIKESMDIYELLSENL